MHEISTAPRYVLRLRTTLTLVRTRYLKQSEKDLGVIEVRFWPGGVLKVDEEVERVDASVDELAEILQRLHLLVVSVVKVVAIIIITRWV